MSKDFIKLPNQDVNFDLEKAVYFDTKARLFGSSPVTVTPNDEDCEIVIAIGETGTFLWGRMSTTIVGLSFPSTWKTLFDTVKGDARLLSDSQFGFSATNSSRNIFSNVSPALLSYSVFLQELKKIVNVRSFFPSAIDYIEQNEQGVYNVRRLLTIFPAVSPPLSSFLVDPTGKTFTGDWVNVATKTTGASSETEKIYADMKKRLERLESFDFSETVKQGRINSFGNGDQTYIASPRPSLGDGLYLQRSFDPVRQVFFNNERHYQASFFTSFYFYGLWNLNFVSQNYLNRFSFLPFTGASFTSGSILNYPTTYPLTEVNAVRDNLFTITGTCRVELRETNTNTPPS